MIAMTEKTLSGIIRSSRGSPIERETASLLSGDDTLPLYSVVECVITTVTEYDNGVLTDRHTYVAISTTW